MAWAAMAASVSVLLGGGFLVATVAFLTTMVIDRVNRVLNRFGLPFFFQQVVGGLIAAAPAATLYTFQDQLGISIRPSLVHRGRSGRSTCPGCRWWARSRTRSWVHPFTAVARFFEVVMMTGGIIAGVAISLRMTGMLGSTLPPINVEVSTITQLPILMLSGACASVFYALACYAERRALTAAFLGGAAGSGVSIFVQTLDVGPVIAAAIAATVVGLAGGLMARRALTPPLVVAVAGITPLLPGLSLYRGLYALLNDQVLIGLTALLSAFGIGCALAAGRHARRMGSAHAASSTDSDARGLATSPDGPQAQASSSRHREVGVVQAERAGHLTVPSSFLFTRGFRAVRESALDCVLSTGSLIGFHGLTQALRTHVGPVGLDVFEARLAAVFTEHHAPAGGDLGKRGPQRVLVLVVHQHVEAAVFVIERVSAHLASLVTYVSCAPRLASAPVRFWWLSTDARISPRPHCHVRQQRRRQSVSLFCPTLQIDTACHVLRYSQSIIPTDVTRNGRIRHEFTQQIVQRCRGETRGQNECVARQRVGQGRRDCYGQPVRCRIRSPRHS